MQRYLAARTDREASRAAYVGAVACVLIWMTFLLLGAAIWGYYAVGGAMPADDVLPEAMRLATKIASGPQDAVQWTKRALNLWVKQAAPAFDASLALEMLTFMGNDVAEGQAALIEKRRPDFG